MRPDPATGLAPPTGEPVGITRTRRYASSAFRSWQADDPCWPRSIRDPVGPHSYDVFGLALQAALVADRSVLDEPVNGDR